MWFWLLNLKDLFIWFFICNCLFCFLFPGQFNLDRRCWFIWNLQILFYDVSKERDSFANAVFLFKFEDFIIIRDQVTVTLVVLCGQHLYDLINASWERLCWVTQVVYDLEHEILITGLLLWVLCFLHDLALLTNSFFCFPTSIVF